MLIFFQCTVNICDFYFTCTTCVSKEWSTSGIETAYMEDNYNSGTHIGMLSKQSAFIAFAVSRNVYVIKMPKISLNLKQIFKQEAHRPHRSPEGQYVR